MAAKTRSTDHHSTACSYPHVILCFKKPISHHRFVFKNYNFKVLKYKKGCIFKLCSSVRYQTQFFSLIEPHRSVACFETLMLLHFISSLSFLTVKTSVQIIVGFAYKIFWIYEGDEILLYRRKGTGPPKRRYSNCKFKSRLLGNNFLISMFCFISKTKVLVIAFPSVH